MTRGCSLADRMLALLVQGSVFNPPALHTANMVLPDCIPDARRLGPEDPRFKAILDCMVSFRPAFFVN